LKILTASWVLTLSGRPLRDGRVAVENGRIVWVGGPFDSGAPPGPQWDLGPGVLLPGLVNAHCHLELSHFSTLARGPRSFVPWVESLVTARSKESPEGLQLSTRAAVQELERSGTVAVGDVSNLLAHLDLLAAASFDAVVFYELLGWDPAHATSILGAAEARINRLPKELAAKGVRVCLAAHAPHSVSQRLLEGLVARGGPAAIHLAESQAEGRFLADGQGEWRDFLERRGLGHVAFAGVRASPVRYLESLGALSPGLLAAHCVNVDAEDQAVLSRNGVRVAICPRSNVNLGVGLPPVPALLKAGIRLCLGTDSAASAGSLNLIEDLVLLHREFPMLEPEALIRMATISGAEALGLRDLGMIVPGKRSALAYAPSTHAPGDPYEFLLSGDATTRRVDA